MIIYKILEKPILDFCTINFDVFKFSIACQDYLNNTCK